ncbi:MAG: hypothetical protein SD837_09760 [Candidatus Electrothrix scaldis]|nr:MAG: hypothetical protein SD837_09760 [Candidatus Electrothrix sp. GW3-3]
MNRKNGRSVGCAAILFGVAGGLYFLFFSNKNIINNETNIFLVKYFVVITVANGSLYFIVMGLLQYFGLIPTFFEDDVDVDVELITILRYMLVLPFLASGSATILVYSDNLPFKISWLLFVIYLTCSFMASLRKILLRREKKGVPRKKSIRQEKQGDERK